MKGEEMNITFALTVVLLACLGVMGGCGRVFAGTSAEFADAVPMHKSDVSDAVKRYGNFIMRLDDYDDHILYDIRCLGDDRIGVIMLSPEGYEKNFVFKSSGKGKLISLYEHKRIPQKNLLKNLERKCILVSSARDFAQKLARQKRTHEKTAGHA
jgi:hypothetical protein